MEYCETKVFSENSIIIREGDVSTCLYYIEEGTATCYIGYEKPEEYLVEVFSKGRFFGETGFLVEEKSTITVVANEDLRLRIVEKKDFKNYIVSNPDTGILLMQHMAKANAALSKHISLVSGELVEIINSIEKNKPVPIDLKKKLLQYKVWQV